MTERQGRLVSKIQGYEGKDQKTSQSLSSVCSWVPTRESEASNRWEESWWWGDRSSSSPGQWQNSNYRQRWHVMESFTLHLYRKGSGQTHVSTYSMIGRIGNERKAETLPLPQPHYHAYGIRREENLMQEQQTDVSLCRRQAGQLSRPCSGTMLGDVWAFLSPRHTDSLQESQISAGCCQQWSWEAVLRYLFQFAIQLFTVLPVACRYHTAKRASREMFDSQPLLQKHWTTTDAESQPTAPTPVTIPPVRAAESSTHVLLHTSFWSPTWQTMALPTPRGLVVPDCTAGQQSASDPAFQNSSLWSGIFLFQTEIKGQLGLRTMESRGCSRPFGCGVSVPSPTAGLGWSGWQHRSFAPFYCLGTGQRGLFSSGSKWK